ncbi:hypothetical protein NKH18_38465 [Streptomyces sp. M10(2022)]
MTHGGGSSRCRASGRTGPRTPRARASTTSSTATGAGWPRARLGAPDGRAGLSLAVDACWGDALVTLEREQLADDADDTADDADATDATAGSHIGEVEIRHASSGTHIDGHLRWIADRVELARRGGIDS